MYILKQSEAGVLRLYQKRLKILTCVRCKLFLLSFSRFENNFHILVAIHEIMHLNIWCINPCLVISSGDTHLLFLIRQNV